MSVAESWSRIAGWYQLHFPQEKFRLAAAASEEKIAVLEAALGLRLPDDIRESYLLHDGTEGTYLVHWGDILSLEQIESEWRTHADWQRDENWGAEGEWKPNSIGWGYGADYEPRKADAKVPHVKGEPIKPIWWNPLRIPITSGSDNIFIDLDPAEGGVRGQIISYSHETGPLRVLAPSLAEWLRGIADALEAGKLVPDEQGGGVGPIVKPARKRVPKKYPLTQEQRAQYVSWNERWRENALSTRPMDENDRAICIEAVNALYAGKELEPPRNIAFVSSPFIMKFAGAIAMAFWYWHRKGYPYPVENADRIPSFHLIDTDTVYAIECLALRYTNHETDMATGVGRKDDGFYAEGDAVGDKAVNEAWSNIPDSFLIANNADHKSSSAEIWQAALAAIEIVARAAINNTPERPSFVGDTHYETLNKHPDPLHPDPLDPVRALTVKRFGLPEEIVRIAVETNMVGFVDEMYQPGNQGSGRDSYLSFFRHVVGLSLDYSDWQHWETLSLHSGMRLIHKDFCLICDRPEMLLVDDRYRLHSDTGPACRWRDGSTVSAVHGKEVFG